MGCLGRQVVNKCTPSCLPNQLFHQKLHFKLESATRCVLQQHRVHFVLHCINKLHVPNSKMNTLYECSNTIVPFPTKQTQGPFDIGTFTDLLLPFWTDLGQIIGEHKGSTRSIRPAYCSDVLCGHGKIRIQGRGLCHSIGLFCQDKYPPRP